MCSRVEVWIASHLDCSQREEFLKTLLESVTHFFEIDLVRVSISSESSVLQTFPKDPKIEYYLHSNQKLQFEHYKHIYSLCLEAPNTKIIFLDDDDILMPNFYQYISESRGLAMQVVASSNWDKLTAEIINDQFTPQDFLEVKYSHGQVSKNGELLLRIDHSGSWCELEIIGEFFEFLISSNYKIGYITDRKFRLYLEETYNIKSSPRPIVIARKWTIISFWASQWAKE